MINIICTLVDGVSDSVLKYSETRPKIIDELGGKLTLTNIGDILERVELKSINLVNAVLAQLWLKNVTYFKMLR